MSKGHKKMKVITHGGDQIDQASGEAIRLTSSVEDHWFDKARSSISYLIARESCS